MYTRKSNGGADRTLFPPGIPHQPGVSFLRPPAGRVRIDIIHYLSSF
nr:MAG TPA: hypothetical protein [Caudoviricetes sp.]